MKKIYTTLVLLLLTVNLWGQVPQQFSYQAVVRDENGQILKNQKISIRIAVLKDTTNGIVVYQETHQAFSNENGLISLQIGAGKPMNGNFSKIDWATGVYYLRSEIDLKGGTNYTIEGTSQLLSVPYALYAANTSKGGKGDKGDTGPAGNDGKQGAQGDKGEKGDTGEVGKDGKQGAQGDKGDKGDKGVAGSDGKQGLQGDKGDKGDTGTPGNDGKQGLQGDKGDTGIAGIAGNNGQNGPQGDKGDKGDTGTSGNNGKTGLQGDKGDKGDTGIAGNNGQNGPQGEKGDKGDTGASGNDGQTGSQGDKGDKGDMGIAGNDGQTGLKGEKGDKGDAGPAGNDGKQGAQGDKGDKGDGFKSGTTKNQLLFWDGTEWSLIPSGTHGQSLTVCDSVLGWTSDGKCPEVSKPTSGYGQNITDVDGNTYKTVYIGNQQWMAENLKTSKYNDGTVIPNVTDNTEWKNNKTGAWCYFYNDANYNTKYGKLYNWYAINATTNDNKNVCPTGWHVPTDNEWTFLSDYLGGENVAGGKMKEVGTTNWISPNKDAINTSLFSALPGEFRYYSGGFGSNSERCDFWSSTENYTENAWYRNLHSNDGKLYRFSFTKDFGLSIRCLKD
jgi:uncharacterized protein (TIGR02145 family)